MRKKPVKDFAALAAELEVDATPLVGLPTKREVVGTCPHCGGKVSRTVKLVYAPVIDRASMLPEKPQFKKISSPLSCERCKTMFADTPPETL